jgi:hypothetical protein
MIYLVSFRCFEAQNGIYVQHYRSSYRPLMLQQTADCSASSVHATSEITVMLVETSVFEFFYYSSSRNLAEIRRLAQRLTHSYG